MLKRFSRALSATLLLASLAVPLAANASPPARLHTEFGRIHEGLKNGSLNKTQFKGDMIRWRGIRRQMRHDWHHNGGPLTKAQQKAIFRDENRLGERIHDQRQQPPR
ncbi:MAG: hypothetical protein WB615_03145 [Candidatus Tumulicola sp.]